MPAPIRLVLVAILLAAPRLPGAQLPTLAPGTRLRIHNTCEPSSGAPSCASVIAALRTVHGDTLLLTDAGGEDRPLPFTAAMALDTSAGIHGHALAGLGLGTLVGLGAGLAISETCHSSTSDELDLCALWYVVTVPTGAIAGLIGGALVRTERWRPIHPVGVSMHLSPMISPTTLALRARLAF